VFLVGRIVGRDLTHLLGHMRAPCSREARAMPSVAGGSPLSHGSATFEDVFRWVTWRGAMMSGLSSHQSRRPTGCKGRLIQGSAAVSGRIPGIVPGVAARARCSPDAPAQAHDPKVAFGT
jgi:hypothetical protein